MRLVVGLSDTLDKPDLGPALGRPVSDKLGPRLGGGTLVEPWWNPGGTLVEPSWNRWTDPGRTLVKPPRTTPQPSQNLVELWWNSGGTLVELWWSFCGTLPQTTPDHPAALAEPSGTLVELWWNPRGTLPQGRPGPPRSLSRLRPKIFGEQTNMFFGGSDRWVIDFLQKNTKKKQKQIHPEPKSIQVLSIQKQTIRCDRIPRLRIDRHRRARRLGRPRHAALRLLRAQSATKGRESTARWAHVFKHHKPPGVSTSMSRSSREVRIRVPDVFSLQSILVGEPCPKTKKM